MSISEKEVKIASPELLVLLQHYRILEACCLEACPYPFCIGPLCRLWRLKQRIRKKVRRLNMR